MVVDWEANGRNIRNFPKSVIRNESYYFRPGLTYSRMAGAKLSVRRMEGAVFNDQSPSIFPMVSSGVQGCAIASLCNCRTVSWLLRTVCQGLEFRPGYVAHVPLPVGDLSELTQAGEVCTSLKQVLVTADPLERAFGALSLEGTASVSLLGRWRQSENDSVAAHAVLHTFEGASERLVCDAYGLDEGDVQAVIDETGTPAGWYPLIAGYEALPGLPEGLEIPVQLLALLPGRGAEGTACRAPTEPEMARLKARLRTLYRAGRGAKVEDEADEGEKTGEDGDEETVALGARIPIPAETFLEELSQRLEIHPISVYWLLKEMREQEGLVSPPELKRQIEDYASVSVLRLLGYRWPEQDKYEQEHGSILDPALVVADGIMPLTAQSGGATAEELMRKRLEQDFGAAGAEQSLNEFRQWAGRDLGDWLRRDFFKRQIQQFKQRPIAWHFTSAEGSFQAFVLYHRLSRETLARLRTQYAGAAIDGLRAQQERAKGQNNAAAATALQLKIEEIEDFRLRLERIERGDALKDRIRCRWKDEEKNGRPGPYAPEIDDGVKVNVRPFQENGLLAVRQVIKKW